MTKVLSLICFLILLALASYPALAKTSDSSAAATRKGKEKIASREAALKLKLNAFKDRTKAAIAEKVNTNLNRINQKRTEMMQRHLTNMSTILGKLEDRVNSGSPDIKDPASARAAIASARSIIATTSAAVTAQAAKDYTIVVTSESKVRADATAQRQQLHSDLLTLRKMVIDAKQAVGSAIRTAKSGSSTGPKEATASGQL